MNILLTFNLKYLPYAISLIRSIEDNNHVHIDYYIFSNDVNLNHINKYEKYLNKNNSYHIIKIDDKDLQDAPISKRYPREIYYRIFASRFLPSTLDKILYLDPDIIVKGSLEKLYNIDLNNNYFAGATNIKAFLRRFNQIKNNSSRDSEYLNTGVLLFNLKLLREKLNIYKIYDFISERKLLLTLPDQDIISHFFGDKVILVDNRIYNLSDRVLKLYNLKINKPFELDLKWVEDNTIIIHYFGRNKPWKDNYHGILDVYYNKYKVK